MTITELWISGFVRVETFARKLFWISLGKIKPDD